jgi:hypothetical protein
MLSYSQRAHQWHRFYSNAAEDILAVTLCLPFTISLHAVNSIADIISEVDILPRRMDSIIWKNARFMLTLPMMILKAVLGFTLIPSIAAVSAIVKHKAQPPKYVFNLGKVFEKLVLDWKAKALILRVLPEGLDYRLVGIGLALVFNYYLFCKLTNGLRQARLWWPQNKFLRIFNTIITLGGSTRLPNVLEQLGIVGSMLGSLDLAISGLALALSYIEPALLPLSAAVPMMASIAITTTIAWTQSQFDVWANLIEKCSNKVITLVQNLLFKKGIMTFKNTEEAATKEEVKDIEFDALFVSNSNHAFDLAALEGNVSARGLQNYAIGAAGAHPRFDYDDVLRLEKRVTKPGSRYPQLEKFIREHEQDYSPKSQRGISDQSLAALDLLAQKMLISQNADPVRFAEEFTQAKNAFDDHLNKISPAEKAAIENINLSGGNDAAYKLKNGLESVYAGNFCKKGMSRLITATVNRLTHLESEETQSVFWQRPNPTQWLVGMI